MDPIRLIPIFIIVLPVVYFSWRYIDNKYIRPPSKTGFGRGAPGFQTSVRRIAVPRAVQPPEPELIRSKGGGIVNSEWIPEGHLPRPGSGQKGKRRK